ncbi:MAG TPA: metallophosphoesterase family protein [Planctomycetota bacterium]|nr:metallophosphoesterase family protein [Planctomycetota bacterium]
MIQFFKLLLLCASLAPSAVAHDQLIAPGSTWKYRDNGVDLGIAWRDPAFDDSGWSSGPAQLGFGDNDEQTVVSYGPSASNKYITTYFRRQFTVANPGLYASLRVRLLRDDAAVVYVNGVEIVRSNLDPGVPVTFLSQALTGVTQAEEDTFYSFHAPAAALVAGSNVIAVEIHQNNPSSPDLSLDLELIGNTTPILTRGPYLNLGTPSSVVVRWRTDHPMASRVKYGSSPGSLTQTFDAPALVVEHEITIGGLAADTRYYYSVETPTTVLAPASTNQFFRTAPAPGSAQHFRAWIVGDCGAADANQAAVRDAYASWTGANATNLWLMLGDNAYEWGTDEEYENAVFSRYGAMLRKSPLWPTRGNHETIPGVHYGIFSMPAGGEAGGVPSGTEAYYSFDWANAHFVCLDSEGSDRSVGGAMYTWLQADLAANAQEWQIAFWHHPPYTKGSHDSDTDLQLIEMRQNFVPLLEAYGVDLVLCGHSHCYERSFLLDGHYGDSTSFNSSMKRDGGSGNPALDGAYNKPNGPHGGTVYCVAASAAKLEPNGLLDHPAMHIATYRLGSLALDITGGVLEANFIDPTGVVADRFVILHPSYTGTYCKAKVNSLGCTPAIGSSGIPSATNPTPFTISGVNVIPGKVGILLYGFAPASTPFNGGKLCIAPPVKRMPGQLARGVGICGGLYSDDFNARIQSGIDPALQTGVTVDSEYWYRDPSASFGVGLSDALQFTIGI